jgi:pyruvate, water dikinase
MKTALSVGVQEMVRSDRAGAGVMFSIDTETGFPETVLITAAWGLGETVVQGTVDPDEYQVFKPFLADQLVKPIIGRTLGGKAQQLVFSARGVTACRLVKTAREARARFVLTDEEVLQLARWACVIEKHYGQPMDMEWAKDGESGQLFIVQARPETVQSRRQAGVLRSYKLKRAGTRLVSGLAIGDAIATGKVCRLSSIK